MAHEVRELKYILQLTRDYVKRDKRLTSNDRRQMVAIIDKYIASMNIIPPLRRVFLWLVFTGLSMFFFAFVFIHSR